MIITVWVGAIDKFSYLDDWFIHHVVDTVTEVVGAGTGDEFSQKLKISWRATLSFLQKKLCFFNSNLFRV
jgi:hypothetical protein